MRFCERRGSFVREGGREGVLEFVSNVALNRQFLGEKG